MSKRIKAGPVRVTKVDPQKLVKVRTLADVAAVLKEADDQRR